MGKVKLNFQILSYWHAGSGRGEGANLDALVVKKTGNLPFLPGKTVKGLLREAVFITEECGHIEEGFTNKWFGHAKNRFDSDEGLLNFTDATLKSFVEDWAFNNQGKTGYFYKQLTSTALGNGIADDNTLRTIEITIPLTLEGFVDSYIDDNSWINVIEKVAPLVRNIGLKRHRGLGRTVLTISEVDP